MSCSELFSFFRGLRILLKTQGSLWDPDKSIYNNCTSDPPQTQSKCHVTHLKCRAVLCVQAQHVWTHQWRFQSCTVSRALLFPCWPDERWKHYRLEYSIVEQTSLFIDPCERCGDKYLWAEPYLEVVAVIEHGNCRCQNSFYLIMTIKGLWGCLKMIILLLLSSKCNIKLKDFSHWSVLRTEIHIYV